MVEKNKEGIQAFEDVIKIFEDYKKNIKSSYSEEQNTLIKLLSTREEWGKQDFTDFDKANAAVTECSYLCATLDECINTCIAYRDSLY